MMTRRLVTSIVERSARESNVVIARDLGLDEKTVRNVLRVHDEGLEQDGEPRSDLGPVSRSNVLSEAI